jgi:hypothetical protein
MWYRPIPTLSRKKMTRFNAVFVRRVESQRGFVCRKERLSPRSCIFNFCLHRGHCNKFISSPVTHPILYQIVIAANCTALACRLWPGPLPIRDCNLILLVAICFIAANSYPALPKSILPIIRRFRARDSNFSPHVGRAFRTAAVKLHQLNRDPVKLRRIKMKFRVGLS